MEFKYYRPPKGWNLLGWDVPRVVRRVLYRDALRIGIPSLGWLDIRKLDVPYGERSVAQSARWLREPKGDVLEIRIEKGSEFIHVDSETRDESELDLLFEDMVACIQLEVLAQFVTARQSGSVEKREAARSRLLKAASALGLNWFGRPDEERDQRRPRSKGTVRQVAQLLREARQIFRSKGYGEEWAGSPADDEELRRIKIRVIWTLERWAYWGGTPRLELLEKDHRWIRILHEEDSAAGSVPRELARRLVGVERGKRNGD